MPISRNGKMSSGALGKAGSRNGTINRLVRLRRPAPYRMIPGAPGFDCAIFKDGLQAMESFDTVQPELVLLDIMLPGMDGWEVLNGIRRKAPVLSLC